MDENDRIINLNPETLRYLREIVLEDVERTAYELGSAAQAYEGCRDRGEFIDDAWTSVREYSGRLTGAETVASNLGVVDIDILARKIKGFRRDY